MLVLHISDTPEGRTTTPFLDRDAGPGFYSRQFFFFFFFFYMGLSFDRMLR